MKDILDLLARIFIAFIFFYEAYDSIANFQDTKEVMASYGLVWRQDLLLSVGIVFLVLGSILISIGYRTMLGAIMLLSYIIPYTFIAYSFWDALPENKHFQFLLFSKNIAIAGALCLILAHGSGKYSVRRLFATTRVK